MQKLIPLGGLVHELPDDLRLLLLSDQQLLTIWNGLTLISRNEWICWVISVKKSITRDKHIARLATDLKKGKRRPCCWAGCQHR